MLPRCALLLAIASTTTAFAADWPQWLGPNRDGLSAETGLLRSWPDEGPRQAWRIETVGLGYAGPAIVNGRVYIMGSRGDEEMLFSLDEANGEEVWATPLGGVYENDWGDGPRGTPTVVDGMIYALGAEGGLVCLDAASGEARWRVSLVDDLGGKIPVWGYSESPLVDGELVVVTPGGDQGAIAAIDRSTGEVVWQCEALEDVAHYSSPVVAQPHGERQYVQLLEKRLVGLAPKDGSLLWEVEWPGRVAVIPTPVVDGNRVYVTSGYGVGCMLVEIAEDNTAAVVYDNKTMKNHHGGVLRLGDHVFGHSDGVGWLCQEFATGQRTWRERDALGKGAIAYADERFYCLSEDEGDVVLLEASPTGWAEHGRFTLSPQTERRKPKGKIWMHPVIANGRLYLRDQELLFSFDIRAGG